MAIGGSTVGLPPAPRSGVAAVDQLTPPPRPTCHALERKELRCAAVVPAEELRPTACIRGVNRDSV